VRWDDPRLGIAWPDIGMPFALAARDRDAPLLDERPAIE
jgi:dTDP-4-dehydrorhamnose 3,5-epimerase-like enzyme